MGSVCLHIIPYIENIVLGKPQASSGVCNLDLTSLIAKQKYTCSWKDWELGTDQPLRNPISNPNWTVELKCENPAVCRHVLIQMLNINAPSRVVVRGVWSHLCYVYSHFYWFHSLVWGLNLFFFMELKNVWSKSGIKVSKIFSFANAFTAKTVLFVCLSFIWPPEKCRPGCLICPASSFMHIYCTFVKCFVRILWGGLGDDVRNITTSVLWKRFLENKTWT